MTIKAQMKNEVIRVLLVEDNPGDALLLRQGLDAPGIGKCEVHEVARLAAALSYGADHAVDVVLLDLGLPDSAGLETLLRLREHFTTMPVIVLTGMDQEDACTRALQSGAQDYLVKGQIDSRVLQRAVRYAIERHRLQQDLEETREEARQQRELWSLSNLSRPADTGITAQALGVAGLREALPDEFNRLVDSYGELLDLALAQRALDVNDQIPDRLWPLTERLGFLKAGPRDVIEIHIAALRAKLAGQARPKAQAYVEEARMASLQFMGYLLSFYRARALGGKLERPRGG